MSDSKEFPVLKFVKITNEAIPPTTVSVRAAGFDLFSAHDIIIPPMGKGLVHTGLQIQVPHGHYGRIAPRSGLALRHFIDTGAGVVDEDFRGEVCALLFNFSNKPFKIKKGDRVAQLICEKISKPILKECSILEATERGAAGFGSTGR